MEHISYVDYKKFEANLNILKAILKRKGLIEEATSVIIAMRKIFSYLPKYVRSFSIPLSEEECVTITRNDKHSFDSWTLEDVEDFFSSIEEPEKDRERLITNI